MPLGAVMPLVRPSWLLPTARTTPWMRSPSASARSRVFSTSATAPSPHTKPSAARSKVWQASVGDSMPPAAMLAMNSGVLMTQTPPASATSTVPARSASTARPRAVSDDEQAVSTARLGPLRFRK